TGDPTDRRLFRGELFDTIDQLYMAGARRDLLNPDGVDGIRFHFDIGANPVLTDEGRDAHCAWACGTDDACITSCNASVDRERFLCRHRVLGRWGSGGTPVLESATAPSTPEGAEALGQFCAVVPYYTDFCPRAPGKKVPAL